MPGSITGLNNYKGIILQKTKVNITKSDIIGRRWWWYVLAFLGNRKYKHKIEFDKAADYGAHSIMEAEDERLLKLAQEYANS